MAYIAFFDSGLGGVTVMKEARRLLPREDFVYFGDTANAPYGTRTEEDIRSLTCEAVKKLLPYGVKALVIACNTATAAAAATLRRELTIPVIGIEPALKPAHSLLKDGVIAVIATQATLSLQKFKDLMSLYGERACPIPGTGLVELIESNKSDSPECRALLRRLLAPCEKDGLDAIVLGCTHYVYLRRVLNEMYPGVPVVDGHNGTARRLADVLRQNDLLEDAHGSTIFLSSGGEEAVSLMRSMYDRLDPDQ